jgi:drug/metabolite transporter (DMT)-like permease
VLAFIGALFIIKPSMDFTSAMPAIVGFLGGMGAGGAYTAVRALGERGVKGPLIVFFFSAFSCLVVLPFMIAGFQPMSIKQLVMLLLAGLSATGGQFSITAAYTCAPAKEISVFDYTQIIFATALGFILFSQVPDAYSVIGYVIICAVAVIMYLYNNTRRNVNET